MHGNHTAGPPGRVAVPNLKEDIVVGAVAGGACEEVELARVLDDNCVTLKAPACGSSRRAEGKSPSTIDVQV